MSFPLIQPRAAHRRYERLRVGLSDGRATTLHVASFASGAVRPRIVRVPARRTLVAWCRAHDVADAVVGGFFVRPHAFPLGELRIDGARRPSVAFDSPWDGLRSCLHLDRGMARIAPRAELEPDPPGDLLQAGPLLVRDGASAIDSGCDPEGFSAGSRQFDSDITRGRYPRAALALAPRRLIVAVSDGRTGREAGLTLTELAETLVDLGAVDAINLDGGGSASLVFGSRLRNRPHEEHGLEILGGRPVATAITFEPAADGSR
jgi:hypothetical protein